MKQIDLSEVEQVVMAQAAKHAHHLDADSYEGALARFCRTVSWPLAQWRSTEVNRQTHPGDVMAALEAGFGTAVAAHIHQHVEPDDYEFAIDALLLSLRNKLLRSIQRADTAALIHGKEPV